MSSSSAAFGLRPVYHPSGQARPVALANGIASGYASDLLQGQPVKLNASGNVVAAAAGDYFQGAFDGVEWTDATGRRRVSNYWPASTAGSDIVAYFYRDPDIQYEIQGTSGIAQTAVGAQANFGSITAGSTVTGYSAAMLDIATFNTTTSAQLRVLDKGLYPDNDWGDSFTIVRVGVSLHQDVYPAAGY